ncbi:MAG TPA: hypothetical protein VF133_12045 [Terriglobales bacterium]
MRRYISGLSKATTSAAEYLPDSPYLVRVERVQYRWHAHKPYYSILFMVLEPRSQAGNRFAGQLYCTPKELWKLNWFLRDFGYDSELLERSEIDEVNLIGLSGVVKIGHSFVNGSSILNLDGFAPTAQWQQISAGVEGSTRGSEVG